MIIRGFAVCSATIPPATIPRDGGNLFRENVSSIPEDYRYVHEIMGMPVLSHADG
jgi:hypothetical protein